MSKQGFKLNNSESKSDTNSLDVCLWGTWWNVQRSIRYHSYRQAFFEGFSRLVSGLNILLSSAAFASILKSVEASDTGFAKCLMLILAIINTLDLVYGVAKRAWHHRELRNKFIDIEKRFLAGRRYDYVTKADLSKIEEEILGVEIDEPPIYRNLDIFVHNEMVRAYLPKETHSDNYSKQTWFQKLSRNFVRTI